MTDSVFNVPNPDSPTGGLPPSELAHELVASGAHADSVDVNALMAQMETLQARIRNLEAERGVPSDPVAGALQDLKVHTQALANAWPWHDFSAVLKHLESLPVAEALTKDHTELTRAVVGGFTRIAKHIENADYLDQLANDLHINVLKTLTQVA